MWMGPVLFIAVNLLLWRYGGAVFVPEALARLVFSILPVLREMETVILINTAIMYFGAYFVFAIFWGKIKPYLGNVFFAAIGLWLVNILVLFPLAGRGMLGYKFPQGWMSASLPLLLSHWMFARGLQFQDRRS
jgi:hypothetical protein